MGECYNKIVINPRANEVSLLIIYMSTNYGKQIAKNKGAVVTTFVVAFLATYAVMGNGGWQARSAEMSAAVASQSSTPTITSVVVETGAGGVNYLRITGTGFSTTNNLVTVCKVTTASGNCDSKPGTTMYISGVQASTTLASANTIYVALKTKYSSGSAVATSAKHRVFILNNTTKKTSSGVTLVSLKPTLMPVVGTLNLTSNINTPSAAEVVCTEGPNADGCTKVTLLSFNLTAKKAEVMAQNIAVNLLKANRGTASTTRVYLFEGDGAERMIASTVVYGQKAVFTRVDERIPQDSRRNFVIKADIQNTNIYPSDISVNISTTDIKTGRDELVNGSATGEILTFRNIGLVSELLSTSVNTTGVPQASNSTSTLVATFNIKLKAVGDDIVIGNVSSRTPAFNGNTFRLYSNNSNEPSVTTARLNVSYPVPAGAITAGLNNSFLIQKGSEVVIPVNVAISGRDEKGGRPLGYNSYSVGLSSIQWRSRTWIFQLSTFMDQSPDWRTRAVAFP